MDEQFYRKLKPQAAVPSWLKRIFKSNKVRILVLAGVPFLSFILFSTKGVLQHLHLRQEKNEMLQKIAAAQQEQRQLQQASLALDTDPKMIEKVARENYGMIREGETVYKLRKEKP
jgi:cell division protein FtsB